ncbi:MAG: ATP synthase F0 subunit B [Acidobacteria bacterium]|nr:ATP synthase F0 subunit B [Acidobacteriota bacterium]
MGLILLGLAGNSIQLVPDGTLILHAAIIIIMVVVLNRTLFRPINRILEERDRRTRGVLSEAERMLVSIDQSLRQYEQTLRGARAEGYQLLERQRAEAVRERERQIASARELLSQQTSTEKQQIRSQAEVVRTTLSKEARKIALIIASRILGRSVAREGE